MRIAPVPQFSSECTQHHRIGLWITVYVAKGNIMKQTWTSQDGRTMQISEIALDHLLNIVHDTHFRIAKMRTASVNALGGLINPNVNEKTKDAFVAVRPADVFPAWKSIVRYTRKRFEEKFGFPIGILREVVFHAWETGEPIDRMYEEAVRFVLCDNARTIPPRLMNYVATFRPSTDAQYRVMCWNLRRDQPVTWSAVMSKDMHRVLIDGIPPNRLKSALNFTRPVQIDIDMHDIMDDTSIYDRR